MESLDLIAEALAAHGARFVVIGNYGAQLHGIPVYTEDADMAYLRSQENHQRIMTALEALGARIRIGGGETVRLPTHDPVLLERGDIWNLTTRHGDLDLLYDPAGGG